MFKCQIQLAQKSRFVDEVVHTMVDVEKFKESHSISLECVDEQPPYLFHYNLFAVDKHIVEALAILARDKFQKLATKEICKYLLRIERTEQMTEIISFLQLIVGEMDNLEETELLNSLSKLYAVVPDFVNVITQSANLRFKDLDEETYDFLHWMLEIRWYELYISFELQQRGMATEKHEMTFQSILCSLIRLALLKFSLVKQNELHITDQFYCDCVRNLWMGIISLSASGSQPLDFWENLYKALKVIQNEKEETRRCGLSSANDFLFVTWLISGIASLSEYSLLNKETFEELPVVKIDANYTMIESITKDIAEGKKSEEQLRTFLLLVKPIYCRWWTIKHDFLFSLWQFFGKRFNSPFQLPAETFHRLEIPMPASLIEQGRTQASQQTFTALDPQTSSFKMFLSMIAYMVRHYTADNKKNKVQILFNRTALSFPFSKFDTLTGQGIYNFSLLVFTLLGSTHYKEDFHRLSKVFQQIKLVLPVTANIDETIQRITAICTANIALLVRLSQQSFDKGPHLKYFIAEFDKAWLKYGDRLQPALSALAKGMCALFDTAISSGKLAEGDEKFFGAWLVKFLRGCSEEDRDQLFNTFNRLLSCFYTKELFRMDYDTFLEPLYQIVLPFVKEIFVEIEKPCPIVVELAANFTLLCTGQQFAGPFISLFSYFADNAKANPVLRLRYTQLIVNSDRVDEIEARLIIRCWAKLCIVCTSEEMREFSEYIFGMKEFQSICEIPTYDLEIEGDGPIGLFFKYVGKKYQEYEGKNSNAQLDMRTKMHGIFQHFDKWMPQPNRLDLKKIIAVLALAFKECAPVFYIHSNSACLFHVAFNSYCLPLPVRTNRQVSPDLISAMGKTWFRIIDALGRMDYARDPCISDYASNMMIKWAPQFLKFKERNDTVRPYVLFISSKNEQFITFVIGRYLHVYVELNNGVPKDNAEAGLKMLLYTLDALVKIKDSEKVAFFIRLTASAIMRHASVAYKTHPSKTVANEIVLTMLEYAEKGFSNIVKMELEHSFKAYTKNHAALESINYFEFMCKLAERNPEIIQCVVPTIIEQVVTTERLLGFEDSALRKMLHKLESVVQVSLSKQNRYRQF
ncbi:uncharacterized protein LOC134205607 isoform X3 [Armigeres subalbatus]|uniref:uncharacterized protein LOC134205607 isoform X3 n=1 Tax=Armigeres subalbatus TaxID=124917 RepID=UPI002ED1832C